MSTRALVLVALGLVVAPAPAHAGLGALAKLAKLGKVGSQAGKAAKAAKFAKAGATAAKVGKAGALGVTGAVAAERAGLAFARLGDDAARSTAFLARTAEGELLWATKAAGTETISAGKVGEAVSGLGSSGGKPALLLDHSAAELAPQIARENPAAELVLLEGQKRLPLRQKPGGELGDLVVDVAGEAVDLGDYLGAGVEETDESDAWPILGGAAVLLAFVVWLAVRKKSAPQPA